MIRKKTTETTEKTTPFLATRVRKPLVVKTDIRAGRSEANNK